MTAEYLRDAAIVGAILGFFASTWFGWALENPPASWRKGLTTGAIVSLITVVAGGVVAATNWDTGTVFDESTARTFGIVVGVEVGLAGLGAGILAARQQSELIPVWIALVVGVHFFPLGALLEIPVLYVLAALMTVGALVSWRVARSRSLAISAVTGLASGSLLLATALFSLPTTAF